VVAAAIRCGASRIVTHDRRFTNRSLSRFALEAATPDEILVGCYDRFPEDCSAMAEAARRALTITKPSRDAYLAALRSQGLREFARRLRCHTTNRAPGFSDKKPY
jgi:hypothetical protein